MIFLGTDIVDINRFATMLDKWGRHLRERLFTPHEIDYCQRHAVPAIHFAARFAAKEAVRKALHAAGRRTTVPFLSIEIRRTDIGVPTVILADQNNVQISISLSHTDSMAIAMVTVQFDG